MNLAPRGLEIEGKGQAMRFRWTGFGRLAWWVVAFVALAARSEAQYSVPSLPVGNVPIAPQGQWAEIITATPTWLVLQNKQGQQFPVSLAAVRLFLMRWPTSANRLAPDAWVEATGFNQGSNQIRTDHVDVLQGASRSLVPELKLDSINERGQYLIPLLMDTYSTAFGDDFRRPTPDRLPVFLHVVGPVINRSPLMVGSLDNTRFTVLGPQGDPDMSLITFGSPTFVRQGDVVWYDTADAGPRTLTLTQLMVYKNVPLDKFAP